MTASLRADETRILAEIGTLASRMNELRRTDAIANHAEILRLTSVLQARWTEIRKLRAEPPTGDTSWHRRGSRD